MKENEIGPINGFFTEEVRDDQHSRIGFDVVDLNQNEKRAVLARTK